MVYDMYCDKIMHRVYPEFIGSGYYKSVYDGKSYITDMEGKIVYDICFDDIGYFYDGLAEVVDGGKWNYLSDDGNILSSIWFDDVGSFDRNGKCKVFIGDRYNYMDGNGLLSDSWYTMNNI